MNYADRPFTTAVSQIRRSGATYEEIAMRTGQARSVKWFWDLLHGASPWAVRPPGRGQFKGMASLLGVSTRTVKDWIAEEWYDTKPDRYTPDTMDIAATIASLDEPHQKIIKELAKRLWRAQTAVQLCEIKATISRLQQGPAAAA